MLLHPKVLGRVNGAEMKVLVPFISRSENRMSVQPSAAESDHNDSPSLKLLISNYWEQMCRKVSRQTSTAFCYKGESGHNSGGCWGILAAGEIRHKKARQASVLDTLLAFCTLLFSSLCGEAHIFLGAVSDMDVHVVSMADVNMLVVCVTQMCMW